MLAYPVERFYRAHEGADDVRGVTVGNLNYALVPFVIGLLLCGVIAFFITKLKAEELESSLPYFLIKLVMAGVAFWMGAKRVLWLRIDEPIKLVRLFSTKRYSIDEVEYWGFLWGPTEINPQPPPFEANFRILFSDGTEFERAVAPHFAKRIADELNRLAN